MASYSFLTLSLIISLPIFLYSTVRWLLATQRPSNFPPGPPTLPGLGNLHQIPRLWHFLKLDSWAKEYGPILGLKLGSQNVVVLNDASLIYDLVVKKGSIYSERPSMHIAQEYVIPEGRHSYAVFMQSGYSNRLRAISKHVLVGAGLSNLVPLQKAAATHLVFKLLESGEEWLEHLKIWYVLPTIGKSNASNMIL